MKLHYRGVLYEYYLSHTEAVSQSVLRYRGVFYLREMRSTNLRLNNTEVVHPPSDITQIELNRINYPMHIQPIGFLYKLYCMGWKNGSLNCFSSLQNWLLSIFLYYRQGYSEGSQWKQNCLTSLSTEMKLHSDLDS